MHFSFSIFHCNKIKQAGHASKENCMCLATTSWNGICRPDRKMFQQNNGCLVVTSFS